MINGDTLPIIGLAIAILFCAVMAFREWIKNTPSPLDKEETKVEYTPITEVKTEPYKHAVPLDFANIAPGAYRIGIKDRVEIGIVHLNSFDTPMLLLPHMPVSKPLFRCMDDIVWMEALN